MLALALVVGGVGLALMRPEPGPGYVFRDTQRNSSLPIGFTAAEDMLERVDGRKYVRAPSSCTSSATSSASTTSTTRSS